MSVDPFAVGIVGYGRFGQFWAAVLADRFPVLVVDLPDGQADLSPIAAEHGIQMTNLEHLCAEASTIFLCVPINALAGAARHIKAHLRPGSTVIDVCSVKMRPAQDLLDTLSDLPDVNLIATHPMFGPDSASRGLDGLTIVTWPLRSDPTVYQQWEMIFQDLGLNVLEFSPEQHDRMAAQSQAVAQMLGRVMTQLGLASTPIDTPAYQHLLAMKDMVSEDSWELFQDLQTTNPFALAMRFELENALNRLSSSLYTPKGDHDAGLSIGMQGGKGSFTHEAAKYYCRANGISDYSVAFLYTADNVLDALQRGEIDRGVLVIQNARGGVVMETIQAMSRVRCDIQRVFDIVISHCLLHHPDAAVEDIDTVISHPQALAQCKTTLARQYSHLAQTSGQGDLIDQALCAEHIAEGLLPPTTAVLAPKMCADLYGLAIHAEGLQDLGEDNLTTFVWVRRRELLQ
ncbi:MAG: prephenate dehydrogenase/arogenate dehydrogenase family protein [Chloroflexi bacterium]|nr:prephenate dehydrogenase/arogenate dehydrogenase family protein [Chloroflexota bacterium]